MLFGVVATMLTGQVAGMLVFLFSRSLTQLVFPLIYTSWFYYLVTLVLNFGASLYIGRRLCQVLYLRELSIPCLDQLRRGRPIDFIGHWECSKMTIPCSTCVGKKGHRS